MHSSMGRECEGSAELDVSRLSDCTGVDPHGNAAMNAFESEGI